MRFAVVSALVGLSLLVSVPAGAIEDAGAPFTGAWETLPAHELVKPRPTQRRPVAPATKARPAPNTGTYASKPMPLPERQTGTYGSDTAPAYYYEGESCSGGGGYYDDGYSDDSCSSDSGGSVDDTTYVGGDTYVSGDDDDDSAPPPSTGDDDDDDDDSVDIEWGDYDGDEDNEIHREIVTPGQQRVSAMRPIQRRPQSPMSRLTLLGVLSAITPRRRFRSL